MNFWIFKDGATQGPYAESQLRTMWQNGIITADVLCCREGGEDWVPVSTIAGDSSPATAPKSSPPARAHSANISQPLLSYPREGLLKIVSSRDAMVSAYLVSVVLNVLSAFVNAPVVIFIALLSWLGVAGTFFVLVRSLKGGVLAASIAFIAALVPFLCLVTAFFLYGWAERDLKEAGIKLASSGKMKNQIEKM
jgi:hypothetical protein